MKRLFYALLVLCVMAGLLCIWYRSSHGISSAINPAGTIEAKVSAKRYNWNPEGFVVTVTFRDLETEQRIGDPIEIDNVDIVFDAVGRYGDPTWENSHLVFKSRLEGLKQEKFVSIP